MTDYPAWIYAWSTVAPNLAGTWGISRYTEDAQAYILATEHDIIVAEKDAAIRDMEGVIEFAEAVMSLMPPVESGLLRTRLKEIRARKDRG